MSKKDKKNNEYATPDIDAKHVKAAEHTIQSNSQVSNPSHLLARIMALEEKVGKAAKIETPKVSTTAK